MGKTLEVQIWFCVGCLVACPLGEVATWVKGVPPVRQRSQKTYGSLLKPKSLQGLVCQGQILAVWIVLAKLPSYDLSFALDFWLDSTYCKRG